MLITKIICEFTSTNITKKDKNNYCKQMKYLKTIIGIY